MDWVELLLRKLGQIDSLTLPELAAVGGFVLTFLGMAAALFLWLTGRLTRLFGAARRMLAGPPRFGVFGLPTGREVVGREEELGALRAALKKGGRAVLKGQGGVGKSALARAFVAVEGRRYRAAIWARAETADALFADLAGHLAGALGRDFEPTQAGAKAAVAAATTAGGRWLFVFDNATAPGELAGLVPDGAQAVVTTREGEWPGWETVTPKSLDTTRADGPATRLLMEGAGRREDAEGARALAEDLGGLPLALVVMGGYVRAQGGSWAENRGRIAEIVDHEPGSTDYRTRLGAAVALSYDSAPEDARLVADLCAWWAAEGLAPALLTEAAEGAFWSRYEDDIPEPVRALAKDPARTRAAFGALAARSLLAGADGVFAMHRTAALALRARQAREGRSLAQAAAALLAAAYPGGDDRNPGHSANWPDCRRLTPHVRALYESGAAAETEATHFLFNQASIFLDRMADSEGSLALARAGLEIISRRLPEAHRGVAVGRATLGAAYLSAGQPAEGEAEIAAAVRLNETHRSGSADLASSYDLHGAALLALARAGARVRLPEAARRFQQALALRRRLAGRLSDPVAEALNNLGAVRDEQGRRAAALHLYRAAMKIRETIIQPADDARLGAAFMNFGASLLKTRAPGAAAEAEAPLRKALAIRENAHEDDPLHPDRVIAAEWLAACLLLRARQGAPGARRETRALARRYRLDFAKLEAGAADLAPPGAETP